MKDRIRRQRTAALRLLVIGACTMATLSCGDDQSPVVLGDGTLLIGAQTTGSDLDANGYLVSVNSGQGREIGNVDTIYVTPLEPGNYVVSLAGVSGNCSLPEGDNPQDATVVPGDTIAVIFDITCEPVGPPPGGGNLVMNSAER